MICDNCGKNNANVKYTQIINGKKKEMYLCDNCSKMLGINNITFNMPISFSSMLGGLFDEIENAEIFPKLNPVQELKCNNCNLTFEEFLQNGKFGCAECYNSFGENVDEILKRIQGNNRHIGRLGKIENMTQQDNVEKTDNANNEKVRNENSENQNKIEQLKSNLKDAIKEERYEDAAKIRDEIKKLENKNK